MSPRSEQFVLYVEDNADDVDLTLTSFKERNFPLPIKVVRDGAEALEFLFAKGKYAHRDFTETPVLILLDLNLPKVHGLEVLMRIREDKTLRPLVVVILTSSMEDKDRIDAEVRGANLYIQKPTNYDDFGQVAAQIEAMLTPGRPGVRL